MPAPRKDYPEAVKLYKKGMSLADVASFYNITRQSMHKWFKRRKVKMRGNVRFGPHNVFHRGGVTQDERARAIYRVAVKRGKLINPKICSVCGSNVHVSGHHDDYNKPLDVRWLCHACHYLWHTENVAGPAIDLPPKTPHKKVASMGGKASWAKNQDTNLQQLAAARNKKLCKNTKRTITRLTPKPATGCNA